MLRVKVTAPLRPVPEDLVEMLDYALDVFYRAFEVLDMSVKATSRVEPLDIDVTVTVSPPEVAEMDIFTSTKKVTCTIRVPMMAISLCYNHPMSIIAHFLREMFVIDAAVGAYVAGSSNVLFRYVTNVLELDICESEMPGVVLGSWFVYLCLSNVDVRGAKSVKVTLNGRTLWETSRLAEKMVSPYAVAKNAAYFLFLPWNMPVETDLPVDVSVAYDVARELAKDIGLSRSVVSTVFDCIVSVVSDTAAYLVKAISRADLERQCKRVGDTIEKVKSVLAVLS